MKPFSTVFQQSYFEKVTSKSFIIITLILILLIILGSNYDYIYKKIFEKEKEITLIAPDKQTYSFLTSLIKKNTDIEKINSYDMSKAKQKLADGTIDYIIEVSNQSNRLKVNVFYNNENKLKDIDTLNLLFNNINVQQIINKYNIENSDVKLLNKENITLKQVGGIKKSDQEVKNFNIFIVVIILSIGFFIVVNYANQIAVDIAKEKSTRVSEIIITSIAPQIHLYAKIFSVIAVALTQIIILFLTIILCNYI
ncbi:ABC transporter permease, partial [Staphylococcus pseudintermedius]|nr:ABC transporter permease [Staphylococcus pseudintermedius]